MKKQHRLPLISLILLSLLVCLGAFVGVWILAVDAKTFSEKIQTSLTIGIPIGIPIAIGLIILVWLGAGIDQLLARIQKRSTRVFVSLMVYLFAPGTLCVGIPALLILLFSGSVFPQKGWQELPAPPSPAVEVMAAGESSVTIRTSSDEYYYCWTLHTENCWDSTTKPDSHIIKNDISRPKEITTPPGSEPPQKDVSLIGVSYNHMGVEVQAHYAVLEDGSVWFIEKDADKYENGFLSGLLMTFAVIPALSGLLVIYLGAGVSSAARGIANRIGREI